MRWALACTMKAKATRHLTASASSVMEAGKYEEDDDDIEPGPGPD
jgi:hypothetical protein